MITYMTRHMIALQGMTYAGQDLMPGDSFYATPDDEGYFVRNGRAKPAGVTQEPRRFVPSVAPIGETSTVVAVLVPDTASAADPAQVAAAAPEKQVATDAPPQGAPAESAQAPADNAKAADEPAAPAATRPAPAARSRTRLLTGTGEASN
jgi:hypothetical protein